MKKVFKKIFIFLGISIVITVLILAFLDVNKREKSINENKHETIGKVYDFNSNRSFNHYEYRYYFKGKLFSDYEDLDDFDREECIGRFYRIYLSTKNPEYSKILLDQEITDTSEILKAGFTIEDIHKK